MADGATLDQELGQLLEQETFSPPDAFREHALVSDPSIYETAEADPEGFWAERAGDLHWFEPWEQVLDWSNPPFAKWFVGGKLNVSYNCLDRHVEAGNGDRVAFHWRGEEGEERDITYAELHSDVQRFANALKDLGIGEGDVVGIFLPMIPEVTVAMLACTRIGAVHNVVFGGFSAESLRDRINDCQAVLLVTADGGYRRGQVVPLKRTADEALRDAPSVNNVVVVQRQPGAPIPVDITEGRDHWYHRLMQHAGPNCEPEAMNAEDMLYVLYTSGTTGKPKGIVHTTGGYLVGVASTHHYIFDLKADEDVYWCAADIGWVTGHSYVVYGPLANGATVLMYEGAPDWPDKDRFWAICERYGVTIFYTAPTAIRAFMKWGAQYPARYDLSRLRLLGSVGEPINPEAWMWYQEHIGRGRCPIVDTWWQTETGAIMISPLPGLTATKPGSATVPFPGIAAALLDSQANEIATAAGRTEVRGPAIRVTLDDAKLAGGEVPAGADPDDYVIHQQDVQSVVNALWAGGAEAMMLQDQRVISTSAVRCVGNTLILQGRVYSPPYVITAIGSRDAMRSALDELKAAPTLMQTAHEALQL